MAREIEVVKREYEEKMKKRKEKGKDNEREKEKEKDKEESKDESKKTDRDQEKERDEKIASIQKGGTTSPANSGDSPRVFTLHKYVRLYCEDGLTGR